MSQWQQPKNAESLRKIYVGIGGWTYPPWRGSFYPKGLPQAKELTYAASRLSSIEINETESRPTIYESRCIIHLPVMPVRSARPDRCRMGRYGIRHRMFRAGPG